MIKRTQTEIMQSWGVDNSENPLVSVRCITFNHEKYISQAIDSFLMQETNFPFEIVIHDDASIDHTADIIREYEAKYPKIVKPIYETENQHSKHDGSIRRIMQKACKGKYIAYCEGDDYWISKDKLQKQADILERYKDVAICYCKVQAFEGDKDSFCIPPDYMKEGFVDLKAFINSEFNNQEWTFHTSSFFIRNTYYSEYLECNEYFRVFSCFPYGDMPTQLYMLCKGRGYFINEVMSKYRLNSGGYNSSVKNNPGIYIREEKKLIKALKKFDKYKSYEFHNDIKVKIFSSRKKILLKILTTKYPTLFRILRFLWRISFSKILKMMRGYVCTVED